MSIRLLKPRFARSATRDLRQAGGISYEDRRPQDAESLPSSRGSRLYQQAPSEPARITGPASAPTASKAIAAAAPGDVGLRRRQTTRRGFFTMSVGRPGGSPAHRNNADKMRGEGNATNVTEMPDQCVHLLRQARSRGAPLLRQ